MAELSIIVLSLAGCVFAVSSAGKLSGRRAYRSFLGQLAETGLITGGMVCAAAATLCGVEATAAVGLLAADALAVLAVPGAAWLAESALAVTAALTTVLALGVTAVVRRGTRARCACFGARSWRPLGRVHLARNLTLLAVVCAGLVAVPLSHGRSSPPAAVLAAVAGAVTALLFVHWDDIAALFAVPGEQASREG